MYAVSRTETIAKLFFFISFVGLFLYIILVLYAFHTAYMSQFQNNQYQNKFQSSRGANVGPRKSETNLKHILLWTQNKTTNLIGEGQEPFSRYDCSYQNCYITTKIQDLRKFSAIVFNASDLRNWEQSNLPTKRSPYQKYVFYGRTSSSLTLLCHPDADTYFNWTWSYKLYSDIVSPFFVVKNFKGQIVAPNAMVIWDDKINEPLYIDTKNKYPSKYKALAWIMRDCSTTFSNKALKIAKNFQKSLRKRGLVFDIFGCNYKACDKNECLEIIKRYYFFYWVYEWTLSEDYVTDKVVVAFETETVPLITGNSDIGKFLPPGSYISHKTNDVNNFETISNKIHFAINNPPIYNNYFQWKKHYTIHRTPEFYGLCELCSKLNNEAIMSKHEHYEMLRRWWNNRPFEEICSKRLRNSKTSSNFTPNHIHSISLK